MTCSLADTKIVFESSGMQIVPYQIDFRTERSRMDYAKIKITRDAGLYVSDNFVKNEAVRIETDSGHVVRRLCLPDSPVEIGVDFAWLNLTDPRYVLQRGVIDVEFQSISLSEAVKYVFDNRDDSAVVLSSYKIADPELSGVVTEDFETKYDDWLDFLVGNGEFLPFLRDLSVEGIRLVNSMTGWAGREGGFDFNGVTPAVALSMIEEEFGVESWVDDDGRLWVGLPEPRADLFIAASGHPDYIRLKSFNVSSDTTPVTGVTFKGSYKITVEGPYWGKMNRGIDEIKLQTWAVARWKGHDEGRTISADAKRVISGEDLGQAALTRLASEIHSSKKGDLILNPISGGTEGGHPTDLKIGDHIGVVGTSSKDCAQQFESDVFLVNGLRHKFNSDVGWEITAEVGKAIPEDELTVDFWYFDPTSQTTLTTEEAYKLDSQ